MKKSIKYFFISIFLWSNNLFAAASSCGDLLTSRLEALAQEFVSIQTSVGDRDGNAWKLDLVQNELEQIANLNPELITKFQTLVSAKMKDKGRGKVETKMAKEKAFDEIVDLETPVKIIFKSSRQYVSSIKLVGDELAVLSHDQNIKGQGSSLEFLDAKTGVQKSKREFPNLMRPFISPDLSLIIGSPKADPTRAILYSVKTGQEIRQFSEGLFQISSALISADGSTLLISWEGHIVLYDLKNDSKQELVYTGSKNVQIELNADESILSWQSGNNRFFYSIAENKLLFVDTESHKPMKFAWSEDPNAFYLESADLIRKMIYDGSKMKDDWFFIPKNELTESITLSRDQKALVITGRESIRLFHQGEWRPFRSIDLNNPNLRTPKVLLTPNAEALYITSGNSDEVHYWVLKEKVKDLLDRGEK